YEYEAARPHRRAQGDEPERLAGEDVVVLELAGAGRLRLSGQRQDRRLGGRRGNELIFKRGTAVSWSEARRVGTEPSDGPWSPFGALGSSRVASHPSRRPR